MRFGLPFTVTGKYRPINSTTIPSKIPRWYLVETFIYLPTNLPLCCFYGVIKMARKIKMKTGDFLQEVNPEGWYNLEVDSIEDYTPTEDTKSYGDAVYVTYTVTIGEEELGTTRELCSLKLSPLSKLYDRYTSALNLDEIEGGVEVDVDLMVGKKLLGLLTNDSRKDSKFVTITRTKPYVPGVMQKTEPEEEPEQKEETEMGAEEDETEGMFQCGDCDADVPEDADECPGCGATFEDTEAEDDTETILCAHCGEGQQRRELRMEDGKFYHDEYGLRCKDEYLKEKKKKKREANKRKAKTPAKKKVTKKATPKKTVKKGTKKKR